MYLFVNKGEPLTHVTDLKRGEFELPGVSFNMVFKALTGRN